MEITKELLISYDEFLALPGCEKNEKKLLNILDDLTKVNTNEIPSDCISSLFCHVISKFDEDSIKNIGDAIWNAFHNIHTIAEFLKSKDDPSTEERILLFLHDLINDEDQVSDKIFEDFKAICGELEEIKYIFIMKNENEKHYFPIEILLQKVMSSYKELKKLDSKAINTFILAMEMFTLENDINNRDALNSIVDNFHLEGLKILFKGNQVYSSWKENLKQNGVLVLVDRDNHKIYIRSEDGNYFDDLDDAGKLLKEKNYQDETIAYYLLKDYSEDTDFISLKDIFSNPDYSREMRLTVIDKIFNEKYYNVLSDNCFIKQGNEIKVLNEFSYKDNNIVIDNSSRPIAANPENIFKYGLHKYNLNTLWGNDTDYVMYGSLFKLLLLCPLTLKELYSKMNDIKSSFQDNLISSWLESINNDESTLPMFIDSYFNEINYIRRKIDMDNIKIEDIYWLPCKFPTNFIINKINSIFDTQESTFQIEEIESRKSLDDELEYFYNNHKINKRNIIKHLSTDEERIYYVFKKGKKYYIDDNASKYLKLLSIIQQKNDGLKSVNDFSFCRNTEMRDIRHKMELQKDALILCQKGFICDFNTVANLRIIHHIIYNSFDKKKWTIFYNLLNKHQEISYSKAIDSFSFDDEYTLYVSKEAREQCGALSDINDKYIKDKTRRDLGLYVSNIEKENGLYTLDKKEIKRIVIVFDTLQSGISTKNYFSSLFSLDETSNKPIHNYYCKGEKVSIKQLIETNKPEIQIVFLYGTNEGQTNIQNYIKTNDYLKNAEIICLKTIDVLPADDKFVDHINTIYSFQNIEDSPRKGFFPIIREFNQPKRNIFPNELLNPDNIASLFVKKSELPN